MLTQQRTRQGRYRDEQAQLCSAQAHSGTKRRTCRTKEGDGHHTEEEADGCAQQCLGGCALEFEIRLSHYSLIMLRFLFSCEWFMPIFRTVDIAE